MPRDAAETAQGVAPMPRDAVGLAVLRYNSPTLLDLGKGGTT